MQAMSPHAKYPALSDLRARAQARVPRFVWEYLDSGTGSEATKMRNRIMLDRVRLSPSILHGEFEPDISATLLGRTHDLPVGIAPVGMSGLICPIPSGIWRARRRRRASPTRCRPWRAAQIGRAHV